jgi:hypothetical protein
MVKIAINPVKEHVKEIKPPCLAISKKDRIIAVITPRLRGGGFTICWLFLDGGLLSNEVESYSELNSTFEPFYGSVTLTQE